MRSKWKIKLVSSSLKVMNAPKVLLSNAFVNKRLEVYNGKKMLSILFRNYMINKRLSNFVSSKYTGKNIHVKRKKRKIK